MASSRFKRINHRHILPDIILVAVSLYASLWLRVGQEGMGQFLPVLNRNLALFVAIRIGTFIALGVYDIIWRYISLNDSVRLLRALVLSAAFIMAATFVVDIGRLPRAVFFIDLLLSFTLLAGMRFGRRIAFDRLSRKAVSREGRRTLVVGAGMNGRSLTQRLLTDGAASFNVLGFVDDDPQKVGRVIAGHHVLGPVKELPVLLERLAVQEVIVALSRPPGSLLRELVQVCRPFGIRPRMISGMSAAKEAKHLDLLREVQLSDLLSRPVRRLDFSSVRSMLSNRRVLVTGAGGSIGSELARQILGFRPSRLLLLDHSEYNLYRIDNELRCSPSETDTIVPLLADVTNQAQMERIFRQYSPEVVFHAAAYKHVHLVEANPHNAIVNNVEGTRVLLEQSERTKVSTFVLISTDKAVNPAGVMGATKRVCELMVADAGMRTGKNYCAVRFGNVLGSSGSLIPLLKRQIAQGEPVTITHPDMTRYFMLIPEAVSLVLCAATLAEPADVMILRMGEPVRIVDIAQSLIVLMGKTPEEVPIVFTGLRPGEKLYEELYLSGKEIQTENEDILVLSNGDGAEIHQGRLDREIERLVHYAKEASPEAVFFLRELVKSTYDPHLPLPPRCLEVRPPLVN